jgi:hypothetical protein
MTLKWLKKTGQYLQLCNEKYRSEPTNKNYDILCIARPALHKIKKFEEHYFSSHDMAVDEAMTGLKGRFQLK